jgi:hypothetical protein
LVSGEFAPNRKILKLRLLIIQDFCFSALPFLKFNPILNTSRDEMVPYPFVFKFG